MSCEYCRWVWNTWVKAPILRGADLLIASACLPAVNPALFEKLRANRVVLFACPEQENPTHYGKIASIIRSSRPRRVTVVTIDGSPHCFTLHASVNEAEYILGERIDKEHYVLVNGSDLERIDPNAVRVARYLSLVNKLIEEKPEVVRELERYSEEYRRLVKRSVA